MFQQLVGIAPWTVIFTLCNLALTMFIFKRFLWGPVQEIVSKRKDLAEVQLTEAAEAKAEALAMKSEYEENMAKAKEAADEIVARAQKTATSRSEEILHEAQAQAAELRQKAEKDIALERKKAVNEIKDEIGTIAVEIASKVVEREINAKDHEALIDEFIENVGEAS